MGNKNYTKYSEQSENTVEESVNTVEETVVEPEVETVVEPEVETVVEPEVTTNIEDIKEAIVTGCVKLNVRKEASKTSEVVCVIEEFTEVTIDESQSTEDFYKISTSVKGVLIEGYCMKKFINIK